MANLDKERIQRLEAEIREARKTLTEITSGTEDDFLSDHLRIKALRYTLIVLVESICNLCRHVLAKKAQVVVEEYMETILKMREEGFLSEDLTNRLVPLTKLRHQLIHGYWKTDDRRLFLETRDNVKTIDAFISEMKKLADQG